MDDSEATTPDAINPLVLERLRQYGMHAKESMPRHRSLPRASVLLLLSQDGRLLMTQRSMNLRSHPGEVCFPGGKQDEDDKGDDATTAVREFEEEMGVKLLPMDKLPNEESISHRTNTSDQLVPLHLLCTLPTIETRHHVCVTGIVGYMSRTASALHWRVNPDEVAKAFWVPLQFFLRESPIEEFFTSEPMPTMKRKYLYENENGDESFIIRGATSWLAHRASQIAYSTIDSSNNNMDITDSDAAQSNNSNHGGATRSGMLYRKVDATTGTKGHWITKYFVFQNGILHQYDNEQMAQRKGQSANKKHRLMIRNSDKDLQVQSEVNDKHFAFSISVLDGRIIWHLAALDETDRQGWIHALSSSHSKL